MPTPKYFDKCPEFPSDIPVLNIPTISLSKLEQNEDAELSRLYDASRKYGFFRLVLQDSENGRALLQHAEGMLDISADMFSLEKDVLNKFAYNPPKDLLGYKTAGKLKTDDGKLDAMEMYTVGQDDMLGTTSARRNPDPLEDHRTQARSFFLSAGGAVKTILSGLDTSLGLSRGTLSGLCPLDKPSDTSLRMLLSRPLTAEDSNSRITLGGHTDIGSITMLFNIVGGLQVLPAAAENVPENWRYIKPQPGSAVVNLGDTIVEWTGGVLRSSLHRVVNPPGQQAAVTRQSLAYLVRPAREMTMRRLRSVEIPPVAEGEQDNTTPVTEWAMARAGQIIRGELRPRTTGGNPVDVSG